MKYQATLIVLLLSVSVVCAQAAKLNGKGKIIAKVTDAATKLPVEYASIAVYKQGSPNAVNGTTTDPKGNFSINNLPVGQYTLSVDFIGYKRYTTNLITISSTKATVVLGDILITPNEHLMKDVNVTAQRASVQNKIDKMIYNPGNDITTLGGVATDVLKKVPMVTVDIDGNVELQGDGNIKFLINGKPSSIFGSSLADALQSIPASQIKSIEVITSPGAKYDASGTGGIINIILKDSKIQGINGTVNLSGGTRLQNGSVNINVRKGNFGVGFNLSGNAQLTSTVVNTTSKENYSSTADTLLYQSGNSHAVRGGYQTGLNFNWSISKKDELTASIGTNRFGNHSNGSTNIEEAFTTIPGGVNADLLSYRASNNRFSESATDFNVDYKKTFNTEDRELDIGYSGSFGNENNNYWQNLSYGYGNLLPTGSVANDPGKDRENELSIDYVQPISDGFTLETGAKWGFESLSSNINTDTLLNNGDYTPNPLQTYGFNYRRNIYAGYVSLTFQLFNKFLTGKSGLRYERTNTNADFQGVSIPGYNTFAPSFVLTHKLDKTQSIKGSFSYRIERPDYGDLNPFYNISDPHNISQGNPNLRPEIGHNFELGYNKSFNKGSNIYFAGFYRYNTDDMQTYTTPYDTLRVDGRLYSNVSLTQRYNLGTEVTTGASIFGSAVVSDKFTMRTNMFFADRISKNPGNPTVSGFTYRINLNASYEFSNSFVAEVFGNYNASQRTIQGTRPAFAFYNIAVRKQFWNKKASLGLTAANPFNAYYSQKTTIAGATFSQYNLREVPLRSFGISLSYKFGKLEFKKDSEKDNEPAVPQGDQ